MVLKLVFFDMDGTLFRKHFKDSYGNTSPSAWAILAKHLGQEAFDEEEKTKIKWTNGYYAGYVEWMEETIKIHQKYGLTKAVFFTVMNSCEYYPGVGEVCKKLKEKGIRLGLISGSFQALADRALVDLKIDHALAACDYFWNDDGTIAHFNLLPCDYHGKVDFMKLIMQEHGFTPEECAFVGDGRNDIPFARAVGLSIAFNGAEELQRASTYAVNQKEGEEDFSAVLSYLLPD